MSEELKGEEVTWGRGGAAWPHTCGLPSRRRRLFGRVRAMRSCGGGGAAARDARRDRFVIDRIRGRDAFALRAHVIRQQRWRTPRMRNVAQF